MSRFRSLAVSYYISIIIYDRNYFSNAKSLTIGINSYIIYMLGGVKFALDNNGH